MFDYFTTNHPFQIRQVGDFLKPTIECSQLCACPVKIKVNWLNMLVPFPCGQCSICKSLKKEFRR